MPLGSGYGRPAQNLKSQRTGEATTQGKVRHSRRAARDAKCKKGLLAHEKALQERSGKLRSEPDPG